MGFLLFHVTPSLLPPKPGVPRRHTCSSALQPDNSPKGLSVLDGFQPLLAETLPGHRAQHCTSLGPSMGGWGSAWLSVWQLPLEGGAGITSGGPPDGLLIVFSAEMDGSS